MSVFVYQKSKFVAKIQNEQLPRSTKSRTKKSRSTY